MIAKCARTKVMGRGPIKAFGKPELPFQVINAGIFGPIKLKSFRGHRYVLATMYEHNLSLKASPVKPLLTKLTCKAFN